jgi:hypothetical protein
MMPQLVTVRHRRANGRWLRLYVPVLPAVLLLSPLLLLAVLGGVVACLYYGVRPGGALRGVGRLLCALPGARLEMEEGRMAVSVSIR